MQPLVWEEGHFGELTATDEPYRYEVFSEKGQTQLRVIRRYKNLSNIILPIQDFSIYVTDMDAAKSLAEELNALLRKYAAPITT
jgi:hypothetical protein